MNSSILDTMTPSQMQDTLRVLKDYRNALKQVWKRSVLQDRRAPIQKKFIIEHPSLLEKDILSSFVEETIRTSFPEAPADTIMEYRVNDTLIGWVRIFYGDDMVDASFAHFSQSL